MAGLRRSDYDAVAAERDKAREALAALRGRVPELEKEIQILNADLESTRRLLEDANARGERAEARAREIAEAAPRRDDAPAAEPSADQPRWRYAPGDPPEAREFVDLAEAERVEAADGPGSWFDMADDAEREYHRRRTEALAEG